MKVETLLLLIWLHSSTNCSELMTKDNLKIIMINCHPLKHKRVVKKVRKVAIEVVKNNRVQKLNAVRRVENSLPNRFIKTFYHLIIVLEM